MLAEDIAQLMTMIPLEEKTARLEWTSLNSSIPIIINE